MSITRRGLVAAVPAVLVLVGCASVTPASEAPPIVFVHGNGDSAALWQTTLWRFESNGWPRERLHAIDLPYPLARDDDRREQPGRTSTAEHRAFVAAEVEKVRKATGARQVILVGNSRGGYAIRNYVQSGGVEYVSHAILGGTPNHGVQAIKGYNEGSEFSGTGPFLTSLNAPKNGAGDEVAGPVRWMTLRSDGNDKFAQPDGTWIGLRGKPTFVTAAGPALRGAHNVVLPGADHRETSFSPAAFDATYRFITGRAPDSAGIVAEARPRLSGKVMGLGLDSADPRSGNFANNLPLPGAELAIYAVDARTGERLDAAAYTATVGTDGRWGPFEADPKTPYEFVISARGYATTHIYRSHFPRGSDIVHLRPERPPEAAAAAAAVLTLSRPRGYFDPARDRITLDGQVPPGIPPGAGVSSVRVRQASQAPRPVMAEFNGERVVGRPWPAAEGHVTVLELTY